MSGRSALLRAVAAHLLGVAMVGLAVVPWAAVTGVEPAVRHLGVAVVGATVVSVVLARRVGVAVETLVSAVAATVVLLLVVVGDPLGFGEVGRGLRDGVPRILSTGLPLLDVAWAGVPGTVVAWAAAAVVASVTARSLAVGRPLLAVLAAFGSGYALTLGAGDGDLALVGVREALLLALLAGGYALVRRRPAPEAEDVQVRRSRLVAAVGTIVLAVAAGAVTAQVGPFLADEPVVPRLVPAADELEPTSPLLVTRRLREDEPERTVGTVTADRDWSGYVPIAVLDRYDGRAWSRAEDQLLPTGGEVAPTFPVGDGPAVEVAEVDVVATGGWLPFVARVEAVEGLSVLESGGETFRPAEAVPEASYRLRTAQPSVTLEDPTLTDARASARSSGSVRPLEVLRRPGDDRPAGQRVCRLLALSSGAFAGSELGLAGAACGERAPDEVGFLRTLADQLARGRAVAVAEDGGSVGGAESLADLLDLVGPAGEGSGTGSPEQFAAAYALMADSYGFPTRLVTGFRVEDPAADEPHALRGEDAWSWVEVAVEDVGWVVVDPTPSAEDVTEPDEPTRPEELEEPDGTVDDAPVELDVETQTETVVVGPPPAPEPDRLPSLWALAAVAVAVLVLLPLLVATLRRAFRRRGRRTGGARARTIGAWHEVLDAAHEVGLPELASRTTAQVVDQLAAEVPELATELPDFGRRVDTAVYSSRPVSAESAAAAWDLARRTRRALRRGAPLRTRLAWAWRVTPRWVTSEGRRRRRVDDDVVAEVATSAGAPPAGAPWWVEGPTTDQPAPPR
ncbi:transglutaminase domain-containing protein [Nitriliruptoraceae bacterium ZYF776]|nr:transglutaminase domain-containing protein [Profundirhabdus halotolerans]